MNLGIRLSITCGLSVVLAACTGGQSQSNAKAVANSTSSIWQGSTMDETNPVAKAAVRLNVDGMPECSATMIGSQIALTAAHCIDLEGHGPKKLFEVVTYPAQSYLANSAAPVFAACTHAVIDQIHFFPDAQLLKAGSPFKVHFPDLALVHLQTPLCSTVPAQVSSISLKAGDRIWAAGFGAGSTSPSYPDKIELEVISSDEKTMEGIYEALDARDPANQQATLIAESLLPVFTKEYLFAIPTGDQQTVGEGDSGGPVFAEIGGQVMVVAVNGAVLPLPQKGRKTYDDAYFQVLTPLARSAAWIQSQLSDWK